MSQCLNDSVDPTELQILTKQTQPPAMSHEAENQVFVDLSFAVSQTCSLTFTTVHLHSSQHFT